MIHVVRAMLFVVAIALYGCGCGKTDTAQAKAPAGSAKPARPHPSMVQAPSHAASSFEGTVAETTNAGRYVYVRLTAGAEERWFAMPQQALSVGDRMAVSSGLLMTNFHSDTLGRTFEKVYFASGPATASHGAHGAAGPAVCPAEQKSAAKGGDACCPTMPQGHAPVSGAVAATDPGSPATTTMFVGVITEMMQAGRYTYVQVTFRTNQIWAAVSQSEMHKGDKVSVPLSMPMRDFKSPTLKRSFDLLYMAPSLTVIEKAPAQ